MRGGIEAEDAAQHAAQHTTSIIMSAHPTCVHARRRQARALPRHVRPSFAHPTTLIALP